MFLVRWFWSSLQSLGLINVNARMVFLGLDNAGKTTLLHMLRDGKLVQHTPTHHPTTEELSIPTGRGGQCITFTTYDVGGHTTARPLWSSYGQTVDAIVYLVDASDRGRIQESRVALDALLVNTSIPTHVPIAILGNKIDKDDALSKLFFIETMGIPQTTGQGIVDLPPNVRPLEVFMCSVANREGYGVAFKWISQYVK